MLHNWVENKLEKKYTGYSGTLYKGGIIQEKCSNKLGSERGYMKQQIDLRAKKKKMTE